MAGHSSSPACCSSACPRSLVTCCGSAEQLKRVISSGETTSLFAVTLQNRLIVTESERYTCRIGCNRSLGEMGRQLTFPRQYFGFQEWEILDNAWEWKSPI